MFSRRAILTICAAAALAVAPAASAAPVDTQYGNPATTPGSSDTGAAGNDTTQPVSGNDALGNAAGATDDQSAHAVRGGGEVAAVTSTAPAPAAATVAGVQLPFTGMELGTMGIAGLMLLGSGIALARSGRRGEPEAERIPAA